VYQFHTWHTVNYYLLVSNSLPMARMCKTFKQICLRRNSDQISLLFITVWNSDPCCTVKNKLTADSLLNAILGLCKALSGLCWLRQTSGRKYLLYLPACLAVTGILLTLCCNQVSHRAQSRPLYLRCFIEEYWFDWLGHVFPVRDHTITRQS